MPGYYRHRQIQHTDKRHIKSVDQLERGAEIAVFDVLEGTSKSERLIRTAAAFAGIIGRADEIGRTKAAKEAWAFEDLKGLLPLYHGTVEWVNSKNRHAAIAIIGNANYACMDFAAAIEAGVSGLVAPDQPTLFHASFSDLGIAPKTPYELYGPNPLRSASKGWETHVTLRLD